MKQDLWKLTRRPGVYHVEVQYNDITTGKPFFSTKAKFTTQREAKADKNNREATGAICRITDSNKKVII